MRVSLYDGSVPLRSGVIMNKLRCGPTQPFDPLNPVDPSDPFGPPNPINPRPGPQRPF